MKRKYFKILTIMLLMFPISAFADSLKVNCSSVKLEPNKTTNCTITGTTSSAVSSVSAKLKASGNIKITDIKANSIWQGDGEGGNIELYTDSNKTGTFNIASFTVTATGEGTGTINVSNIVYSDADFEEKSVANSTTNITVAKKEATPTPAPTQTTGDATLKSLTVTPGDLSFSKNTTTYTVSVPKETTSVSIKATASDTTSKVSIPTNLNLTGDTTTFKVVVTAKDNTKKTYTINVVKKGDKEEPTATEQNNANIKTMSIEGVSDFKFDPNNTYYTVKTNSSKLNINVELEDETSEYNILGNNNIQNGDTVLIQVKSKDGTVKEYRLKIVKEETESAKDENKGSKIPAIVFVIAEILWLALLGLYIKLKLDM